MKRAEVLKRIKKAAKAKGFDVETYELTRHTGIKIGQTSTTLPRHTEVADTLAREIFKQLESELGKGWWRR